MYRRIGYKKDYVKQSECISRRSECVFANAKIASVGWMVSVVG
jgi:hypothetical protein